MDGRVPLDHAAVFLLGVSNMKLFKTITLIVLTILLLVSPVISFDQNPGKFKEFEGWVRGSDDFTPVLSDGWLEITVVGHAEGLYPDILNRQVVFKRAVGMFAQGGTGFHIGGGWIVTNAHVVRPEMVEITMTPGFSYAVPVDRIIDVDYFIGTSELGAMHGQLVWINESCDLALLWVDPKLNPLLKDYGYRPVWTREQWKDRIHEGDSVATIVRVRNNEGKKLWHYEVRYGRVTATKPILPPGISNDFLPWFGLSDITIDLPLYPGDSGSPIFAFDNGKPVIIGLGRAGFGDLASDGKYYSYATRIDLITLKSMEVQ